MKTVRLNKTMNCVKRALVTAVLSASAISLGVLPASGQVGWASGAGTCGETDVHALLEQVSITSRSHIYVTGAYTMGGSLMVEDTLELDPETTTTRLQIGALGELGSFCAYWIDDDFDPNAPLFYDSPTIMFDHPVRFAWTKQGSSRYGVLAANNSVTIYVYPFTQKPRPFEVVNDAIVDGVQVAFGTGEFAAQTVNYQTRELQQDPAPLPEPNGCLKLALSVDGGDKSKWLGLDSAAPIAIDAANIGKWLAKPPNGFNVSRRSQNWNQSINAYAKGNERNKFLQEIDRYGNLFANTNVGNNCHHEFFLYIGAHGNVSGFRLFDADGVGRGRRVLYDDLFDHLDNFPKDAQHKTTVYVMVNSCYSGGAVLVLSAASSSTSTGPRRPSPLPMRTTQREWGISQVRPVRQKTFCKTPPR